MSPEAQDALVSEIASKHGVKIGTDDPIMMITTINAGVLRDAAAQQQQAIDAFKQDMEGIAARWNHQAKGMAEPVLTAALTAAKSALAEELETASLQLRREFAEAANNIQNQLQGTRQAAMLNVIAAGLTCAAVALAVWLVGK
ncbi:conjugal transfer protein TraM [uncultured Thiodictyon sp.]|uniref:conjugal transfer protein TraM n=1 Tax=uncultured Thiodictyon sp. TaxID=1846217 RepID=UPI0025F6CA3D|nr:conjugal transfer protein TraM [uncultured Thiodictyon sp.]